MKKKIQAWFNEKVQSSLWIHQNKKMRVKFRWIYTGVLFGVFLLFLAGVVLFYFYGLRFDSEQPAPSVSGSEYGFLAGGIVLFLLGMIIGAVVCGMYFPMLYKQTREIYLNSDEYKQQVHKYSDIDLDSFTKRELKWLKKLGWINNVQYQQTMIGKQKRKEQ